MIFKEFANKVKPIMGEHGMVRDLRFKYDNDEYYIFSSWGAGEKRDKICIWGKKVNSQSQQIYPFQDDIVDTLEFYKECKNDKAT